MFHPLPLPASQPIDLGKVYHVDFGEWPCPCLCSIFPCWCHASKSGPGGGVRRGSGPEGVGGCASVSRNFTGMAPACRSRPPHPYNRFTYAQEPLAHIRAQHASSNELRGSWYCQRESKYHRRGDRPWSCRDALEQWGLLASASRIVGTPTSTRTASSPTLHMPVPMLTSRWIRSERGATTVLATPTLSLDVPTWGPWTPHELHARAGSRERPSLSPQTCRVAAKKRNIVQACRSFNLSWCHHVCR